MYYIINHFFYIHPLTLTQNVHMYAIISIYNISVLFQCKKAQQLSNFSSLDTSTIIIKYQQDKMVRKFITDFLLSLCEKILISPTSFFILDIHFIEKLRQKWTLISTFTKLVKLVLHPVTLNVFIIQP